MALFCWISLAMIAFAANSLFCRLALTSTDIEPASFTFFRLGFGALTLLAFSAVKGIQEKPLTLKVIFNKDSLINGAALFIYALCFSFAYISLSTGTGALLLFGTVQLTLFVASLLRKERFSIKQCIGFSMAICGITMLMLPSATTPSLEAAFIMVLSGIAWGVYTINGKRTLSPVISTTGNFVVGTILVFLSSAVYTTIFSYTEVETPVDSSGVFYAFFSGALASACGYVVWYRCLPLIQTTTAAVVQLSVPVIALIMGAVFLQEPITLFITASCILTLCGIFLARKS